jgi:hypothetical protein
LSDANVTVTVRAGDTNGSPIGNANVCLINSAGGIVEEGTTPSTGGNQGVVRFNQVTTGTYLLVVHAPSFVGRSSTIQISNANQDVPIALQAGNLQDGVDCTDPDPESNVSLGNPGLVVVPGPLDDTLVIHKLQISNLSIDGGAVNTNNPAARLTWDVAYLNVPFDFRVSAVEDFSGIPWLSLDNVNVLNAQPSVIGDIEAVAINNFTGSAGKRTVFVQLRNRANPQIVSNVLNASIIFHPLALVTVQAGNAYEFARENGWTFSFTGDTFFVHSCTIRDSDASLPGIRVLYVQSRRKILGTFYVGVTGCSFTLFGGHELNEPWTFESQTIIPGESGQLGGRDLCGVGDTSVTQEPSQGDSNMQTDIIVATDNLCFAVISEIVLQGPEGVAWTEAFIQN